MSTALTFLVLCLLILQGFASEDEERLVRDMFKGYNKLIRPVRNISDNVKVKFGVALFQLINVDEKNQIMKTNVWLQMSWNDYQLIWDASDYGGINSIRLPPDKVWKPDVVLFNNADGNYEVSYKPNAVIYSNGDVLHVPPAIYKSSCTIDVTFFPFDEQHCKMKFSSWTFNGNEVVLEWFGGREGLTVEDYIYSGTWDLIEAPGELNWIMGDPHKIDITFVLQIRRKTLFYTVNLITPCVLISFLSVLMFYLPTDAGEKITLGISILLSLVVFLLLVSKILPPTSQTLPLIAKYLLFTFMMNMFSILVTVVIISWNFRGPTTHKMPNWVHIVFLNFFPKILLMRRPIKLKSMLSSSSGSLRLSSYGRSEIKYCNSSNKLEFMELSDIHHPNCRLGRKSPTEIREMTRSESESSIDSFFPKLSIDTHRAAEAVEFVAMHLKMEDDDRQVKEDWKYVAMVIDRLQLYIFFLITASGTMGLLLNAPHIFEFIDQEKIIRKISGNIGS